MEPKLSVEDLWGKLLYPVSKYTYLSSSWHFYTFINSQVRMEKVAILYKCILPSFPLAQHEMVPPSFSHPLYRYCAWRVDVCRGHWLQIITFIWVTGTKKGDIVWILVLQNGKKLPDKVGGVVNLAALQVFAVHKQINLGFLWWATGCVSIEHRIPYKNEIPLDLNPTGFSSVAPAL